MNNPFDVSALTQKNIEALVQANTAAVRGFEQMSRYFFEIASKSVQAGMEAGAQLAATKNPVEFAQLQAKFAKESLQTMVNESKKISELAASIVKDASQPMTENMKSGFAVAGEAKTPRK